MTFIRSITNSFCLSILFKDRCHWFYWLLFYTDSAGVLMKLSTSVTASKNLISFLTTSLYNPERIRHSCKEISQSKFKYSHKYTYRNFFPFERKESSSDPFNLFILIIRNWNSMPKFSKCKMLQGLSYF